MQKYIVKRDGSKELYNRRKIENAMSKAFISKDGKVDEYAEQKIKAIADFIENKIFSYDNEFSVEQIQDLVQNGLMNTKRKDVAEEYIIYRNDRTRERNRKSKLMIEVGKKLTASDVQNQNANVDEHSFGGRMGEARDVLTKEYALEFIIPKKMKKYHNKNRIYLHDLNSYACGLHNCLTIPFDHLLKNGFVIRQTDVRGARSINSALQLTAVIMQLQSLQQFGGVSASHIDWTLVYYVRLSFMKHYIVEYLKSTSEFYELDILNMNIEEMDEWVNKHKKEYLDKMNLKESDFYFNNKTNLDHKFYQAALYETRKETYQAVEAMYHNLNSLQSRSGNQLPFSSINYGTCTLPEGRLVIKALLENSIKGTGKHGRTSIFPCGIFTLKKGINRKPGDPNYDLFRLALKSTAKRLYPNYGNGDVSMQKDWILYDRKCKREVISLLSNEEKKVLGSKLEENPELKTILMLDYINDDLVVTEEEQPVELYSTMGKRKLQPI